MKSNVFNINKLVDDAVSAYRDSYTPAEWDSEIAPRLCRVVNKALTGRVISTERMREKVRLALKLEDERRQKAKERVIAAGLWRE